jgi:acylphosphatase
MTGGERMTGGEQAVRLSAWVSGRVQGVGFRWWTRCRARELDLVGQAANLPDGRVEITAEGSRQRCGRLLELLRTGDPPGMVTAVEANYGPATGEFSRFVER